MMHLKLIGLKALLIGLNIGWRVVPKFENDVFQCRFTRSSKVQGVPTLEQVVSFLQNHKKHNHIKLRFKKHENIISRRRSFFG